MSPRYRSRGTALDGLLRSVGAAWLGLAVAIAGLGCARDRVTGLEAEATAATGVGVSTGATASSSQADTTTSTSTGVEDDCPLPDPQSNFRIDIESHDWPEFGPVATSCVAISLQNVSAEDEVVLNLRCAYAEGDEDIDVRIRVTAEVANGALEAMVGLPGLDLFFYNPNPEDPWSPSSPPMSLRDEDGKLLLLAHRGCAEIHDEGRGDDIAVQWENYPGPEGAWRAPFDSVAIRHVGCTPREAIRGGAEFEVPLALELGTDAGLITVHDRGVEQGMEVTGGSFDVFVRDAFSRIELTGIVPVTECTFLVVRSTP